MDIIYIKNGIFKIDSKITYLEAVSFYFFSYKTHWFGVQPPATADEHLFPSERRRPQSVPWVSFWLSFLSLIIIYSFSSICNQMHVTSFFSFLKIHFQTSSFQKWVTAAAAKQWQQNSVDPTLPPVLKKK